MKTIVKFSALCLLLMFSCENKASETGDKGLGDIFYIDKTNGSDTNSGQSESTAWKTFKNINQKVLAPGSQVLLKKGETWNERLEIRGKGKVDQWIKIGSYGTGSAKPRISLTNHEDDIAVLITDLYTYGGRQQRIAMDYIMVDGLEIANTRMGIFYRTLMSTENTGFKVVNCTFENIHCDNMLAFINTITGNKPSNLGIALNAAKGNLQSTVSYREGGQLEYVFPTAIFIGGQIGQQFIDGPHHTVLTEFTVDNCNFKDVFTGIMSWFYYPYIAGEPDKLWRQIVNKVKITNCIGNGFLNGMIAFDGVNGAAEVVAGSDYMMTPDKDGWGIIKNNVVTEGSVLPNRYLLNGTTAVILNNSQNILVEHCEFSKMNNFDHPDGCGFDFESHNTQITLRDCKFISNRGESLLLMNGGNFGGNSRIRICDNLFADNVKATKKYEYDLMFSLEWDGHQDVKVFNNTLFMNKKNLLDQDIKPYEKRAYITFDNNKLYYLDDNGPNVTGMFWGQPYSYKAIETTY